MQIDEETLNQIIKQNKIEINKEYKRVLKLHDVIDEKDKKLYDDQNDINKKKEEVLLNNLGVSESDFRHIDDVINLRLCVTEEINLI